MHIYIKNINIESRKRVLISLSAGQEQRYRMQRLDCGHRESKESVR